MASDVAAGDLRPGMCGWQVEYGTGHERYCAQQAGPEGLCAAHARMAAENH